MSEAHIDSIFSSLEAQTEALNQASETANKILADSERRLVALNTGIEVWYSTPLEKSDADGGVGKNDTTEYFVVLLGFARVEGKWCFAVKRNKRISGFLEGNMDSPYENEYIDSPPSPLAKQSRNLRIKAVEILPNFLEQLLAKVNSTLEKLSNATNKLQV